LAEIKLQNSQNGSNQALEQLKMAQARYGMIDDGSGWIQSVAGVIGAMDD
jgi:hypothetical protein